MAATSRTRVWLYALMYGYIPLLFFGCLLSIVLAVALFATSGGRNPGVAILFFIIPAIYLLVTVGHVLLSLKVLFDPIDADDEMEIKVPKPWIRGLTQLVRQVAEKRGLPRPDEIRLHAQTIAHVYEEDDGRKVLVVGGLALASFSRKGLAGVIAHELGHFHAGDTHRLRVSGKWLRLMATLDWRFARDSLSMFNLFAWVLRGYHFVFRCVWFANSRAAEFDADEQEIEHVGPEQSARTSILISAVEHLPLVDLHSVAQQCVALQLPMRALFTEQARRAREASGDDWVAAFKKAYKESTKRYDSHPCLRERLQATGLTKKEFRTLARNLNHDDDPAAVLVNNWEAVESALTDRLLMVVQEIYDAKMELAQLILGRPV